MSTKPERVGRLKEGMYIVIDNEPYRVVSIEKSKVGKHGSAKARIVAKALFGEGKKTIISPVDAKIDVPIIDKRSAQVLSVIENTVQLMDSETYEVFEALKPEDEEIASRLRPGVEVEYWKILDRIKIVKVRGES